jgi:hypothetical protein
MLTRLLRCVWRGKAGPCPSQAALGIAVVEGIAMCKPAKWFAGPILGSGYGGRATGIVVAAAVLQAAIAA